MKIQDAFAGTRVFLTVKDEDGNTVETPCTIKSVRQRSVVLSETDSDKEHVIKVRQFDVLPGIVTGKRLNREKSDLDYMRARKTVQAKSGGRPANPFA